MVATLVELCFLSLIEQLEYNSEAIKLLPVDLTERFIAFMVDRLHPNQKLLSQTRTIKVRLTKQKRSCTFRFLRQSTVAQAIHQIYQRNDDGLNIGVENYGLFQPAGPLCKARWLREDKLLSFYDLDPSDVLDFKTKSTTIKINFLGPWEKVVHPLHLSSLDKTFKTFVVDESQTVNEIAKSIAIKLGMPCRHPEEFSLKRQQEQDDVVGIWLIPDMTLPEQGIDPLYTTMLLKRQFYFTEEKVSTNIDRETLHFIFCQCLDAIIATTHPCTLDEAVLFAALQMQINFCDYYPQNEALYSIRLKEYLPPDYLPYKNINRDIINSYQKLVGLTEEKAKFGYIQLTKSLSSYQFTFFRVERFLNNKNQTQVCLLGISSDSVLLLDANTKAPIDRHLFVNMKKWQVLHSFFSLYVNDNKEEFLTCEAEIISQVLFTYIHHNLRDYPILQKRWMSDCDIITRTFSRKRMSNDFDAREVERALQMGVGQKCPLYVEPKKIFFNPLFGNAFATAPHKFDNMLRASKIVRLVRLLSELSQKMFRSFSRNSDQSPSFDIPVKFLDKKVIIFSVSENRTVREFAQDIGRRLGIKNTDEFSLQVQSAPDEDGKDCYSWLNPTQSLLEQGINGGKILIFKKKFYFNDLSDDCNNDPVYFNLLFFQSRDAIISNMYTCNKEEAIQLAATLFQINFGDHNPNIHKPGFLKPQDLRFFLPSDCLVMWNIAFRNIEKMIYKEHRKLRGIKEVYAKFRYVQLCRSLKTYGAVFFHVKHSVPSGAIPDKLLSFPTRALLLGFSRKCIMILSAKDKKFLLEVPLEHLRRWCVNQATSTFTLDFGDYEEGCFCFVTPEAQAIAQYLGDYIDCIQTNMVSSQCISEGEFSP